MNKDEIYQQARALLVEWYGEKMLETPGACLYWTQVAMKILNKHGERVIFQAGTMLWTCTLPNYAFGYEWTPEEPFSQEAIAQGLIPEVHMWAALPDRNEIVDFSTHGFKRIATEQYGLSWETTDPPLYLWGAPPEGVLYRPIAEATIYMMKWIIRKQLEEAIVA
jgi:hypothetical protein